MAALNDLPEKERPREKLVRKGPDSLSDAELIAILLRVGVRGKSAVEVACLLLDHHGSLRAIFKTPIDELCRRPGIGRTKAVQLHASLELGRRLERERMIRQGTLSSPRQCESYLRTWLKDKPCECFVCIFLDNKNQVISCELLFRGTIDQVSVYPREVARMALEKHASAIIVAHNHPSGVAEPSASDISITHKLKSAMDLLDIRLLDHLIIGEGKAVSLAERGKI